MATNVYIRYPLFDSYKCDKKFVKYKDMIYINVELLKMILDNVKLAVRQLEKKFKISVNGNIYVSTSGVFRLASVEILNDQHNKISIDILQNIYDGMIITSSSYYDEKYNILYEQINEYKNKLISLEREVDIQTENIDAFENELAVKKSTEKIMEEKYNTLLELTNSIAKYVRCTRKKKPVVLSSVDELDGIEVDDDSDTLNEHKNDKNIKKEAIIAKNKLKELSHVEQNTLRTKQKTNKNMGKYNKYYLQRGTIGISMDYSNDPVYEWIIVEKKPKLGKKVPRNNSDLYNTYDELSKDYLMGINTDIIESYCNIIIYQELSLRKEAFDILTEIFIACFYLPESLAKKLINIVSKL